MLETARELLREKIDAEDDNSEYQALLAEFLVKRYQHHQDNPETSVTTEEASRRIRVKYGWTD